MILYYKRGCRARREANTHTRAQPLITFPVCSVFGSTIYCMHMSTTTTKKILSIEDDAFLSGLVSGKLVENGFSVITANSGLPGIEMAKSEHPDVILLDIMLPDLGGFEVLEKLKADPATATIPVVILSNLGGREEMEKGMGLGATGSFIKSNILPQEVAELIQQIVNKPRSPETGTVTPAA